jgi:acyl dehydratase
VHEDDRFAEEVGFEGMFAHGVMHLSYITQMLCDFAGHPDWFSRIDVRFGRPVYPGDVVTARGRIKGIMRAGDV